MDPYPVCLQFTGDYWLRHLRPDYTEEFATAIDAGIRKLLSMHWDEYRFVE